MDISKLSNDDKRVLVIIGLCVACVIYWLFFKTKDVSKSYLNVYTTVGVIDRIRTIKTSKSFQYKFVFYHEEYTGTIGYYSIDAEIGDSCIIEFVGHKPWVNSFVSLKEKK